MFFKTLPLLGIKPDVPIDDPGLVKMMGESTAVTYDVGGQNIDYKRVTNSCTKSFGFSTRSNSVAEATNVMVKFYELETNLARAHIVFTNGKMFAYDSNFDPVEKKLIYIDYSSLSAAVAAGETVTGDTTATVATVVTGTSAASGELFISDVTGGTGDFSATESLTFSGAAQTADCDSIVTAKAFSSVATGYGICRYGDYMVAADNHAGNSPFKWQVGDANVTNLITGTDATLYKFDFMAEWYLHLIGFYSGQTNGGIDIRWTESLPGATVTFPAANQLYKPTNDNITGVSKLGRNNLLVYGKDSISALDYYPSSIPVFGIKTLVDGYGSVNNNSIINAFGANWFFNHNYGFIRYSGGSVITSENIVSKDIETIIADIPEDKQTLILGAYLPRTRQIVWAIPITATFPTLLLFYNVDSGIWTKQERTGNNITAMDAWVESATAPKELVVAGYVGGSYDGHVYSWDSETDDMNSGVAYDGHRIEPAMHFGDPKKKKFLKAIWFGIVEGGNYLLEVYHRSGETVKELEGESWVYIGSLSLNDPEVPAVYMPSVMYSLEYSNLASASVAAGETCVGNTTSTSSTVVLSIPLTETSGTLYIIDATGGTGNYSAAETLGFSGGATADCDSTITSTRPRAAARYHQIKWGTLFETYKFSINRVEYEYEIGGNY